MIITLSPGNSFPRFRTTLSGRSFVFFIKWSTRYSFYSVDIYENNQALVNGRGLHLGIDLLLGLDLGVGTLKLIGEPATVSNLGLENKLEYIPAEEVVS